MNLRLQEVRIKRNLTQQQVCDQTGISVKRISNYETQAREPDIQTLVILADFYGVALDSLVGRKDCCFNRLSDEDLKINKFGQRIKEFRLERKMSRQELAIKANISTAYLTSVENGIKTPKLETGISLLNALEVSADFAFMDSLLVGRKDKSNYIDYKLNKLSQKSQDMVLELLEVLLDSYKKKEDHQKNSENLEKNQGEFLVADDE